MKKNTVSTCPNDRTQVAAVHADIRKAIGLLGGKWKLEILWLLQQRIHRFNELKRAIPGVT
jgi:DNA-binding HxlR family transcriptional regulator